MHAARVETSERLRQVIAYLRSRGDDGATTADILAACPKCKAVSAAISELRAQGSCIDCDMRRVDDTVIARYRIREVQHVH